MLSNVSNGVLAAVGGAILAAFLLLGGAVKLQYDRIQTLTAKMETVSGERDTAVALADKNAATADHLQEHSQYLAKALADAVLDAQKREANHRSVEKLIEKQPDTTVFQDTVDALYAHKGEQK